MKDKDKIRVDEIVEAYLDGHITLTEAQEQLEDEFGYTWVRTVLDTMEDPPTKQGADPEASAKF